MGLDTDRWLGRPLPKRHGVWPGGLRCALTVDPKQRLGQETLPLEIWTLDGEHVIFHGTGLIATRLEADGSLCNAAPRPVWPGGSFGGGNQMVTERRSGGAIRSEMGRRGPDGAERLGGEANLMQQAPLRRIERWLEFVDELLELHGGPALELGHRWQGPGLLLHRRTFRVVHRPLVERWSFPMNGHAASMRREALRRLVTRHRTAAGTASQVYIGTPSDVQSLRYIRAGGTALMPAQQGSTCSSCACVTRCDERAGPTRRLAGGRSRGSGWSMDARHISVDALSLPTLTKTRRAVRAPGTADLRSVNLDGRDFDQFVGQADPHLVDTRNEPVQQEVAERVHAVLEVAGWALGDDPCLEEVRFACGDLS